MLIGFYKRELNPANAHTGRKRVTKNVTSTPLFSIAAMTCVKSTTYDELTTFQATLRLTNRGMLSQGE